VLKEWRVGGIDRAMQKNGKGGEGEGGQTARRRRRRRRRAAARKKRGPLGQEGRGKTAGLRGAGWGKGGSGQPTTPITPPRPSSQGPKSAQLPFWIFVARAVGSSPIAPQ
jgi:hypothetical protein